MAKTLLRIQGYYSSASSFAHRVVPSLLAWTNELPSYLPVDYYGALNDGLEIVHYCGSRDELHNLLRHRVSSLVPRRSAQARIYDHAPQLFRKALSLGLDTVLEQICREDSFNGSASGQSKVPQLLAELAVARGQYQEALKMYQAYVKDQESGNDWHGGLAERLCWLALKADDRTSADRYHHEILANLANRRSVEHETRLFQIWWGIQVKDYGAVFNYLRSILDEGGVSNFKELVVRIGEQHVRYGTSIEVLSQLPYGPIRERFIKSVLPAIKKDHGVVKYTRALHYLGLGAFREQRFVAATQYFTEALCHWSKFKWLPRQAETLESLAEVAVAHSREHVAIGFYVIAICKWNRSGNFETVKNQTEIFEKLAKLGAIELEPSVVNRGAFDS